MMRMRAAADAFWLGTGHVGSWRVFFFSFSFVLVRLLMGFGGCEKEEEEGCAMEYLRNARGGRGRRGHSGSLWCVMQFVLFASLGDGRTRAVGSKEEGSLLATLDQSKVK